MKKLLFLLLLIPALLNAQDWSTYGSAPFRAVRNAEPFLGKGAGTIESPLQWNVAISNPDTTLWQFVSSGSDGKYRLMRNRDTYLGQLAGTVYIQLVYEVTDSVLATQNWTKNQNPLYLSWISVSDGDTIKTAGRTYFYNSGTSKVYALPTGNFAPKSEFYIITKTCTSPEIEFITGTTFTGAGSVVLENNGVIHFMISEAGDEWIIISNEPQP